MLGDTRVVIHQRANTFYHVESDIRDILFFLQFHDHARVLHSFPNDALPILARRQTGMARSRRICTASASSLVSRESDTSEDRKSTRLNSSHLGISYAVFCLKKKIRWL